MKNYVNSVDCCNIVYTPDA